MGEAIVVGAGIGGVTVAAALAQGGWRVTLLERAANLGEVGAGISVWPAALAVLEGLGITGVDQAAVAVGPAGLRRPNGHWLVYASSMGVEMPLMVHRAHLHDAITARLGSGVTVRTGQTVTGITQDETSATASTVGGQEFQADLIVAADGIRSFVRSALHRDHPGPRYSGYTAYRGIAEVNLPDGGGETWGRAQRFGYAALVDGRIYWYATANRPPQSPPGAGGHHADVTSLFGDWHDPLPALIAATPPGAVLRNDIYDLPLPLVPFATGRVALLGDAGHAMTPNLGQGACSAIEDAAALARHLDGAPDVPTALSRYDAERRPVTAKLVRRSRQLGAIGQLDNKLALGIRDGLLGLGGRLAGFTVRRRRVEQSQA
jgi:2-polyprenyl-6-methoxyphenol hydroxylase-like FAD-dependent oxidoreductase